MSLLGQLAGLLRPRPPAGPSPTGTPPDSTGGRPRVRALSPSNSGGRWAYDAAAIGSDPQVGAWYATIRSPDGEYNQDRDRIVSRVRDLKRNDGWVSGSVNRLTDAVIGSQFRLSAKPNWRVLSRVVDKAFDAEWADEYAQFMETEWSMFADDPAFHSDAARGMTMTQKFGLQFATKMTDGECITVLKWMPEYVGSGGARYATVAQDVDPDLLSNPNQEPDTLTRRGGVDIDDRGAPIGYWFRRQHQNELYPTLDAMQWDRVARETDWGRPIVIHDFNRQRPGQTRGISVFAPVVQRLKALTKYDATVLQQAILQASMGTAIKSPNDISGFNLMLDEVNSGVPNDLSPISVYQDQRSQYAAASPMQIGGLKVPRLFPGEDIVSVQPGHPMAGFSDFEHAVLRNVAAQTGQSAEQVTLDWSRTNYSSARAGMLEAWKSQRVMRDDFATGTATPIYAAMQEEAHAEHQPPMPSGVKTAYMEYRAALSRCRWIGPPRGYIDPVKERQGGVLGMDAAFDTLEQLCAEQGTDWRENIDQRAREIALFHEKGIPLPEWAGDKIPAEQTVIKPQPV